jgi:predicted metal-dependent peptidase
MTAQEILTLSIRRAVTKDVGLASILLYVPSIVVSDPESTAWTDGTKMYFGDAYFKHSADEQIAIAIHEALHVALRHVQRGLALRMQEGASYAARSWNIACDAVINQAIRTCRWCQLPRNAWYPADCLSPDQLTKRPAELWTAEEIYLQIKRGEAQSGKLLSREGAFCGADLKTSDTTTLSEGAHEQRMEQGAWRERMLRAQAGAAPGSVLRRLSADVPRSEVRWEAVLRNFMFARLMPLTESSWTRPSRRTLALGEEAEFVEPGIERQRGIRRAGVVIDTSGSIDDALLHAFIAEINSLISKTGCEVMLVDCDAAVQQVSLHRTPIRDYVAKGGGGTDFRPAMEALEKTPLDVAVYFTDLLGTFPEKKPRFPLLWAATTDLAVPFGRKLLLPTYGGL